MGIDLQGIPLMKAQFDTFAGDDGYKDREPNAPPTIGPILDPFDTWDAVGIVVLITELFPKDCVEFKRLRWIA